MLELPNHQGVRPKPQQQLPFEAQIALAYIMLVCKAAWFWNPMPSQFWVWESRN